MPASESAEFVERASCLSCGSSRLAELSAGRFDEGAVARFLAEDPWGEHPAPFLRGKRWCYVACQECGLAFHRHVLAPAWNERRFSRWMSQEAIEAFEKPMRTPAHLFARAADHTAHVLRIELLTRGPRGSSAPRVLDFGCGYGGFLATCSQFGFEAHGVDRSAAKREHNLVATVHADLAEVAGVAPFHALTLFEVLEHLDDPRGVMLQLRDLLGPGGILVLETPDCSGVRDIVTRSDYLKIHPLDHINGFTPSTLERFATALGFERVHKPVALVTGEPRLAFRQMAKRVLRPLLRATTQQYFRKR
ncbi:MAG: class I SAM-dependent methyltransferase [Planctomycetes bacterium]|jgi:2-polyprenyl-3-methyl-5-hydroxy-6-metoxy-1,4-benzoquinol methylase|nr:class I SAM-dependent methyltransferase [Planctomycetota bacterium]